MDLGGNNPEAMLAFPTFRSFKYPGLKVSQRVGFRSRKEGKPTIPVENRI